ncbi:hypothetical protein PFLUV_G00277970 [Perca fluviatilis]|uniref:Uncharacterized protein n=1 Tax=Perca fluviatilis TaxID=8168 RepID=A0A6A5DT84_PERFL|nr:hypothetical protein PFLUV_G00277970 [Perca fluviatilis]
MADCRSVSGFLGVVYFGSFPHLSACVRCGAAMNASDSDEDSYNERTALVPSEAPVLPSYTPDPDLDPPNHTTTKRVPSQPHISSTITHNLDSLSPCLCV